MANAVLTVLSMTIGFFFIMIGTLKIYPALSDEVYREMRKQFIRHNKVFPFYELTGFRLGPHTLRKIVGTSEVVCGIILAIIPGPLKQVANLVLLVIMLGAAYGHMALGEPLERMAPALVFMLLLICRFIVHLQVRARENRQRAAQEAAAEKKED